MHPLHDYRQNARCCYTHAHRPSGELSTAEIHGDGMIFCFDSPCSDYNSRIDDCVSGRLIQGAIKGDCECLWRCLRLGDMYVHRFAIYIYHNILHFCRRADCDQRRQQTVTLLHTWVFVAICTGERNDGRCAVNKVVQK